MRQFLAVAGLALALATPAFAQVSPDYPVTDPLSSNPRIRGEQEWWRLVAKADAYRQQHEQQEQTSVPQHAAINNGASATDAAVGAQGSGAALVPSAGSTSCAGTNEAGQPWQAGEYCLPGGR